MFQKSTFFMRVVVILLGVMVVVPSIMSLLKLLMSSKILMKEMSTQTELLFPVLYLLFYVVLAVALVPFVTAIYQTLKILGYIDNKETFSEKSIKSLKIIRDCAIAIFALFIVGTMPIIYSFAEIGDFMEGIIIGGAFSLIPITIAVFASMLMKLLQEAIDIKSENDLTI